MPCRTLARICSLTILVLVGRWVHVTLGGVALGPEGHADGTNDTGKLFNWHPVLMTLGFAVLMAEALLSYQAPLPGSTLPRPSRKRLHVCCHAAALLCLAGGLSAVLRSHWAALPAPLPDWYSPHSYLGLTALGLLAGQALLGCYAYLWPRLPLAGRVALGPLHRAGGVAAWLAGLAALGSGLQEKVTFLQLKRGMQAKDLYGAAIRMPAAVLPLLVLLAVLVLSYQVPPATAATAAAATGGAAGSGGPSSTVGGRLALAAHGPSSSGGGGGGGGGGGRRSGSSSGCSGQLQGLLSGGVAAVPADEEEDEEEGVGRGGRKHKC